MDEPARVLTVDRSQPPLSPVSEGSPEATEGALAEVLADLMGNKQVPVDGHFFDDLGANSLVMAHFCARVRKRADLPSASMKDIYKYPTIRTLAEALTEVPPVSALAAASPSATEVQTESHAVARTEVPAPGSTASYVVCGALQLLSFLAYSYVAGLIAYRGYAWVSHGSGLVETYLRSVAFGGAAFVAMCTFPVAAKWILIGRWKSEEFPVWGVAYLRFWLVKSLLHANPMVLFVGNPLYVLYLRSLGARIGKGVTILSRSVPVCTDLLTIGAGSIIRKDAFFLCYRAHEGRIQTGAVTLGDGIFIGEKTVLDIDTKMGDAAQLGHTSTLQSGVSVPVGQTWHGSPAQPTDVDYVRVAPAECGTMRRAGFGLAALLQLLLVYLPLSVGGAYFLASQLPALSWLVEPESQAITSPDLYIAALVISSVLFFGFAIIGLVVLFTVPRLMDVLVKPDTVYPLYGVHYSIHRAVARITNIKFFTWLFGDSSYIVPYLRGLGYDLDEVEQTGSNFGTEVQHETPYLCSVGRGTMVADGLSILNADYSSTSFRVSRATIGAHNFLGNNIAYPAGGRTGENCLLATKVMVPLDGKVREGVGLLGSPAFEIPRTVERDTRFDHLRDGEEQGRRLAAKNRYNLLSMGLFLIVRWVHFFMLVVLAMVAVEGSGGVWHVGIATSLALSLAFTAAYFILVERCLTKFQALQPQLCSIYEPYFWWHERLWKVPSAYLNVFNGTPFKSLIWRILGVRVGSRLFDDGCFITERTLTTIGSDCTLNAGSKIQCHSQEDGTFKSEETTLGSHCTLGVGAFVHYGVTIGDGAVLAPDSFLMKGEEMPAHARWGGNPATEVKPARQQRGEFARASVVVSDLGRGDHHE